MIAPLFFAQDAETVARKLVGHMLHVRDDGGVRRCRVVETEAYVGPHDLACHARAGVTPRTRVMFGPPAHVYVYFVYGMHDMLNVVTGADGDGQAVLIRAGEDLDGDARLDGPGRLTRELGITVARDNGEPLDKGRIWFEQGRPPARVVATPRIGIGFAGEWAHAPLRFVDADSDALSRPLRQEQPRGDRASVAHRRRAGAPP